MPTRAAVVHNLPELDRGLQAILDGLGSTLMRVARFADTRISARAVSVYMKNAGAGAGPRDAGDTDNRLRIVSGDLARAVSGKGGGQRVTFTLSASSLEYVKTIFLPYAAIQHDGGTIRITISGRMRKFFWAMFIQTGDSKWKAMALTKKTQFIIKIKARPYLVPAMVDELPAIEAFAEKALFNLLQGSL